MYNIFFKNQQQPPQVYRDLSLITIKLRVNQGAAAAAAAGGIKNRFILKINWTPKFSKVEQKKNIFTDREMLTICWN